MRLRVAIVDDLPMDAERLENELSELAKGRFQLVCERFSNGEDFTARFSSGGFDLIFMDIRMEGMNGIEAAAFVRRTDPRCLIVFLTTSEDFAWQAFPVHAFDYLLKPFEPARLEGVVSEALRLMDNQEAEIEVRVARQTLRLPLKRVYCAVARNHFVIIVTAEGEYRSNATFREVQQTLLQDARFLLCNRGVIINMEMVLQFNDDCIIMANGERFSVRQKSKTQLFNTFTQYQFRHMKKR